MACQEFEPNFDLFLFPNRGRNPALLSTSGVGSHSACVASGLPVCLQRTPGPPASVSPVSLLPSQPSAFAFLCSAHLRLAAWQRERRKHKGGILSVSRLARCLCLPWCLLAGSSLGVNLYPLEHHFKDCYYFF